MQCSGTPAVWCGYTAICAILKCVHVQRVAGLTEYSSLCTTHAHVQCVVRKSVPFALLNTYAVYGKEIYSPVCNVHRAQYSSAKWVYTLRAQSLSGTYTGAKTTVQYANTMKAVSTKECAAIGDKAQQSTLQDVPLFLP